MSEKAPTKASRKEASARKLAEDSDDSAPEVKKGRGRPKKDLSEKVMCHVARQRNFFSGCLRRVVASKCRSRRHLRILMQ